jgi:hypothetical protein
VYGVTPSSITSRSDCGAEGQGKVILGAGGGGRRPGAETRDDLGMWSYAVLVFRVVYFVQTIWLYAWDLCIFMTCAGKFTEINKIPSR